MKGSARLLILALGGVGVGMALLVGGLSISSTRAETEAQSRALMVETLELNAVRAEARISRVASFTEHLHDLVLQESGAAPFGADAGSRARLEDRLLARFRDAMQAADAPSAWVHFDPRKSGGEIHASLYRSQGRILRTPRFNILDSKFSRDEWWLSIIEQGAERHWSAPYFWSLWNAHLVTLSRRVEKDGVVLGVAGSDIFMDDLFAEFSKVKVFQSGGIVLVNDRLDLLYPTRTPARILGDLNDGALRPVLDDIRAASATPRFVRFKAHDGPRLLAFKRLSNGWIMAVQAGHDEVFAGPNRLQRQIRIVIAGGLLVSLLLAVVTGTLISRQLDRMNQQLEASNLELKQRNQEVLAQARELEQLANNDPLTGLASRRAGMLYLEKMIELAERHHTALSIGYVDVNDLKRVNDLHGHNEGDRLICHVANTLVGQLRESDLVARLGGDELLAVLVGCNAADAAHSFERALAVLANQPVGFAHPVSFSYGIEQYPQEGPRLAAAEFIARADARMYVHKQIHKTAARGH